MMARRRLSIQRISSGAAGPAQPSAARCSKVIPSLHYFFEPYHLWATIDPTIDVLNFYHVGASHLLLDAKSCTDEAKRRFRRLLLDPRAGAARA